jgi:hypothetical protein
MEPETAPLVPVSCLVCGERRHWWGTCYWWHQVGPVRPFPRGRSVRAEPVLLCAPLCGRVCAKEFQRVLRGAVELSWAEQARRAPKPLASVAVAWEARP